ncbi:hypothetical protein KP79_PYT03809 [Mizuhopecten yessoensis]|uniref:Uncharacterized protein n=1 Tax=Mizuhopecten yessoensis TaxID=6573 RepID=A0A210QHM8_MIZYE|nr:hypothetical protein KP79_PYT03809 [Mizuhopecten yessoensis]
MPGQSSGGGAVLAVMFGLLSSVSSQSSVCSQPSSNTSSVYDYSIRLIDGDGYKEIDWSFYHGKVLLLVNVATY